MAWSPDRGRTWTTHVFTDGFASTDTHRAAVGADVPEVVAGGGRTAYALVNGADNKRYTYRTTDGGRTWKRLPGQFTGTGPSLVTADGAHVVWSADGFRASRGGGPYEPVTVTGYPILTRGLQYIPPESTGCHLFVGGGLMIVSDNGLRWRTANRP